MDKNVFVKKYNPDVNSKFSEKKSSTQDFQKDTIQYKKELWKGITGQEFLINVSKPEDFIMEFEKPDFNAIRTGYISEFSSRQNEIKEIEEKNRKIKEAAMQNVMKIQTDLGINLSNQEQKTHNELKQLQINSADLLKEEKQKFNELLNNLKDII
jgi:hypothetical protein